MAMRNEVVQSREPCPVHGEPDLSAMPLLPRIEHDGPMEFPVIQPRSDPFHRTDRPEGESQA
jgi:hypothetical protein